MDIEKSLVWNLQEQAIVEHPTIAIVHKNHSDFFVEGKNVLLITTFQTLYKLEEDGGKVDKVLHNFSKAEFGVKMAVECDFLFKIFFIRSFLREDR